MQAVSDIFLGWQRVEGYDGQPRDFYVRQLRDWKGSADVDTMPLATMKLYSRICAAALARAHARSGDRIAIASYLGNGDTFDRAIADFSAAYADQNERDYEALAAAVKSGPDHGADRALGVRSARTGLPVEWKTGWSVAAPLDALRRSVVRACHGPCETDLAGHPGRSTARPAYRPIDDRREPHVV